MVKYLFYNIIICSNNNIDMEINLLRRELGKNGILNFISKYRIDLLIKCEFPKSLLKNCIRVYHDPLNEKVIWKNKDDGKAIEIGKDSQSITSDNKCSIYVLDEKDIYIQLRSKICEVIRKNMLKVYPIAFHSALISKDKNLTMIIGNKGSGKTSILLNAYLNGWEVYTDELVFVNKENIAVLSRFPAIDKYTKYTYFRTFDLKEHMRIKGLLTGEEKDIIDINISICHGKRYQDIKSVYVLTSNSGVICSDYTENIILDNFIKGLKIDKKLYDILNGLIHLSKMTNVKILSDKILGGTL